MVFYQKFLLLFLFGYDTIDTKEGDTMPIGEKIRSLRKERGLTQKKLGELCGIAEPTIRRYEVETLNPKIETVEKIASALGISAFQLMGAEYLDKKYPDIAKKSKEYEGFIDYLQSLGYIVNQVSIASKIPIENVPEEFRAELNGADFAEAESCDLELIKGGKITTLEEYEFQQLHSEIKDSIAFKLWKKGQVE